MDQDLRSQGAALMSPKDSRRGADQKRLLQRVNKDAPGGCWLWTASLCHNGYGRFYWNGKQGRAHRAAYELSVGPIPDGLEIDHLCSVRACVNPDHLEAVTGRVNLLRARGLATDEVRETHCAHGHEFTPETTSYRSDRKSRGRICRVCRREVNPRYRERVKEGA
jgi:hypothetical protein